MNKILIKKKKKVQYRRQKKIRSLMILTNDVRSPGMERIVSDIQKFIPSIIPQDRVNEFKEKVTYCVNFRYNKKPGEAFLI